jgi:manganese/zinc/iron transport system permease protein
MNILSLLTASGGMHAWAIATAAVVSAGAALVGTLLVVRRMSLLGDAISHAVLPGIVLAVLAGGRPGGAAVLAGAVAAALVTVWLTQVLRSQAGLAEDAGAGVVFTTLFAIGVVIVTAAASRIDLDPSCVLYGILELVPFDTVSVGSAPLGPVEVPRAFLTGAAVLALVSLAALLTWKMQVFTAFDPQAARAAGVPVGLCTTGLLAATALSTVAGFEAVGAILVVAMLVVPAAAAELLVRRLHWMAVVAMLLAVVGSVVGYLAAWRWNTSAAGMIAVVLGIEYLAAATLAPDDGLLSRALGRLWLAWRVGCEDRLAALWRAEEAAAAGPPSASRPTTGLWDGLWGFWLARTGRIVAADDGWKLSPRGRAEAEVVVRSHRLWEAWLGRHVDLPSDHLHPPAEWVEHHLGAAVRTRIEADVGWQASDPHGRDIPPER